MLLSAVQCNYGEDSYDILNNYVLKNKFNGEQLLHLVAEGHMAFYQEKRDGEKLDKYLLESRKAGLKQIIYLNVHCAVEEFYKKHPEYVQIGHDKLPMKAYNVYYWLCVNSPWFNEYIENIKQLCTHDIDGIFLDGPVMLSEGCYCESCLEKFSRKYGKSRHEASFQEHIMFNIDSVTEFVKMTNQAVKSVNPNILLYINNSVLKPNASGSSSREIEPYVDMIGAEGGFVWLKKDTTLWHLSAPIKMAETVSRGKPVVCFIAGDHKPWSYYMHTACETNILYAQTIAHGANIWYGIHGPTEQINTPGGKAAAAFNEFIEENKSYFIKTKTKARVALLWSNSSANYYASSVNETDFIKKQSFGNASQAKGDHYKSFMGFYDLLTRGHIQFDLLDEVSIKERALKKYDVLILPTCACMSEEIACLIKEYVNNGGKLISSFDTGLYDENGNRREKSIISEIQGVADFEEITTYKDGCGYQITNEINFLSKDLSYRIIPSTELAAKTVPLSSVNVLSNFTVPMAGRYVKMPEETFPAILYNHCGNGESIFFAGAIGEFFNEYSNVDYKRMVLNVINHFSTPFIVTDAPESVEMVLREQGSRNILHLINLTGEMTRPIYRIIPINDIQLKINLGKTIKSVSTLSGKQSIPFKSLDASCEFILPHLEQYEGIIIE